VQKLLDNLKSYQYDVVVIGGGGSGSMAAIRAARAGSQVALVEKGLFGRNGCTVLGGFSACAALGYADSRDNPEVHFADTIRSGQYLNDPELVETYTNGAPDIIHEVDSYGVNWDREGDKFAQALMPGHTYPRAVFHKRSTGRAIQAAVRSEALKLGVDVFEDTMVLGYLKHEDKVSGIVACQMRDTQAIMLQAKAVVLATGGCGQLYSRTTTSEDNTGEGIISAWEAGAELMDLEFVQFFPMAQCYPQMPGLGPCAPGYIRRHSQANMYNSRGEKFVENYMPEWRFKATRDLMARLAYKEIKEGRGSAHGGVYMTLNHLTPEEVEEQLSFDNFFNKALALGVDFRKDSIEVTPKSHFFMGGIKIDPDCQTGVPGLLACGEATAGIHGANRLGGNALSEVLVFGAIAGETAAKIAQGAQHAPQSVLREQALVKLRESFSVLEKKSGVRPRQLKYRLKEIMWDKVGIIRDKEGLERAVAETKALMEEAQHGVALEYKGDRFNRELVDHWELLSMAKLANLIASAALKREESRGSHWREDFPETDNDQWLANLITEPGSNKFYKRPSKAANFFTGGKEA
jgi:fumarate reductase (CoM/CoB) subunit A